tara:strand:- start:347 stop:628 length:282 start_codon:yes stop_codon:yes gene_type:complete
MINFSLFTKSASGKVVLKTLESRFLEHFDASFEGFSPNQFDIEGLLDDCKDIYLTSPVNYIVQPVDNGTRFNCFLIDHGVGRIENMEEIILAA